MERIIKYKYQPKYTLGKVVLIVKRHRDTIIAWEEAGLIPHSTREKSSNYRYWTNAQLKVIIKFALS